MANDDELPFFPEQQDPEQSDSPANDPCDSEKSKASSSPKGLFLRNAPLYELNAYYHDNHDLSNVADQHVMVRNFPRRTDDAFIPWTAVFECPVSSIQYPAGSLRRDPGPTTHLQVDDGSIVCYQKKSKARHAAAARALDAIQYKLLGITEPRLCVEDPSEYGDSSCFSSSVRQAVTEQAQDADAQPETTPSMDVMTHDENLNDVSILCSEDDEEEAEEELFIAQCPVPSRDDPPYRKALQALASGDSHSSTSCSIENERIPLALNPLQRLKQAIRLANSWSKAQQAKRKAPVSPSRRILKCNEPSFLTLTIGTALLASLAEANQSIEITSNVYGVEAAASNVLRVLLLHADNLNCTRPMDPNVFRSFLFCLEDPSPITVVQKAEDFVRKMREGEKWNGCSLPKPDAELVNALIQLQAQVGGTSGRYDRLDSDFVPNKESFMSILSSQIYHPVQDEFRGFDADFCHQCIKRMNELSEATQNEALRPDVQVYNAPLRWYGGSQFRKSRPYARMIPPDNFNRIYANGFQSSEDIFTSDAKSIEAWMDFMIESPESRVSPDIETYEAVIQAWTRSGTRSGLERAQEIASRLLEPDASTPQPRLQTIRPVVLAWVASNDPDGPSKIQQLIDLLEIAGERIPGLRPDARMYQFLISSIVYTQGLLLETEQNKSLSLENVLRSASKCDQVLTHLCTTLPGGLKSGDNFLEITPFSQTILSWRNVALAAIQARDPMDISAERPEALILGLEGMMGAVHRFENCVQELKTHEIRVGFLVPVPPQPLTLQLKHLLRFSHQVYSVLTVGVHQIHSKARDSGVPSSIFSAYFSRIESGVRRSMECELVASHDTNLKAHSTLSKHNRLTMNKPDVLAHPEFPHGYHSQFSRITYPDHLALGETHYRAHLSTGWSHKTYFGHVVQFLRAFAADGELLIPIGDVLRLALLLQDWAAFHSDVENQLAIQKLLSEVSHFHQDRRHLRRHVTERGVQSPRRHDSPAQPRTALTRRSRSTVRRRAVGSSI